MPPKSSHVVAARTTTITTVRTVKTVKVSAPLPAVATVAKMTSKQLMQKAAGYLLAAGNAAKRGR